MGSGNVVHNLGGVHPRRPDTGFDWAQRFDEHAKALLGRARALPCAAEHGTAGRGQHLTGGRTRGPPACCQGRYAWYEAG